MSRRKYTNLMIVTTIKQLISSRVSRPTPELVAETEQFLALWRDPEEIEPAEGLLLSREKLYAIRAAYKRSGYTGPLIGLFDELERNVEAAFNVKRGKKGLPAWILGAA